MGWRELELTTFAMAISIITYNCKGFNVTKVPYIRSLLSTCNVLFIQETWLHTSQFHLFDTYFPGFNSVNVCGMNDTEPLLGRPYGGCSILYQSCEHSTERVLFQSKRICAMILHMNVGDILLCNLYMPCDSGLLCDTEEYNSVLSSIALYCNTNNVCHCIIGGDLNTDLSRDHSLNTNSLNRFVDSESLFYCLHNTVAKVNYSFTGVYDNTSLIDHFILSGGINETISQYIQLYSVDNLSDHSAIMLVIDCDYLPIVIYRDNFVPKARWSIVNDGHIQRYQEQLDQQLQAIDIPIDVFQCDNILCNNTHHTEKLNQFTDDIIHACSSATISSIPISKPIRSKQCIPGWTVQLSEARDRSIFWHRLWIDNDKPDQGWVVSIMRSTRSRYHYQLRKLRRSRIIHVQQAICKDLLCNSKDYWKEVRKVRGKNSVVPANVNGIREPQGIATEFALKYDLLYNSVVSDPAIMNNIRMDIDSRVSLLSNDSIVGTMVTREQVRYAIMSMKRGKSGGASGLVSDNFIYGTNMLYQFIVYLLNAMLSHGYAPDSLLLSVLVPIPKDRRGNLSAIDNYRAIALGDILGKILDNIIVSSYADCLYTTDLQFGFKKHSSTIMCTTLLFETVQYYVERKAPVYVLFIDASKAFDRLRHSDLFSLLLRRNMCPIVIRLLYMLYCNQKVKVRWEQHFSDSFCVQNGVKQGGVLSPLLFNIYVDNLFDILKSYGVGCYINDVFTGVFGYADDLVLLAPSLRSLKAMIAKCEVYAAEHQIIYNPKKSKLVCYNVPHLGDIHVDLCGSRVNIVSDEVYLGNYISLDIFDRRIESTVCDLYRRGNQVRADFACLDCFTHYHLFSTYCTNFYGSELWNYNKSYVQLVYTAWRVLMRQVFKLPQRAHNFIVNGICESIVTRLDRKLLKYIYNMIHSTNYTVCCLVPSLLSCRSSVLAENYRYLSYKYTICREDWQGNIGQLINKVNDLELYTDEQHIIIDYVRELCKIRDKMLSTELTKAEIQSLIDVICTE